MSKCVRCGNSFLMRRKVKLKDALICGKCYNELGFDNYLVSDVYKWDDIKDGYDAYRDRENQKYWISEAEKRGLTVPHYRRLFSSGATDMEVKIFATIYAILVDEGKDADAIDISSGDDGSLSLSVDGTIFITYKADGGVKWIVFENESPEKIRIAGAGRMNSLSPRIIQSFDSAYPSD